MAFPYFERSLAIFVANYGLEHPDVALIHNNLGETARLQGNYEVARDHLSQSLAMQERLLGPKHPGLATSLTALGQVEVAVGEPVDALVLLERALTLRTANEVGPDQLALTRETLAQALWDAPAADGRDRPRALEQATLARAGYEEVGAPATKDLARVDAWLASHRLR